MIVDFHVHVVDPELVRETAGRNVIGGWGTNPVPPLDPDSARGRLLAPMTNPTLTLGGMDRSGVDVSVVSSSMVLQNSNWAEPDEQAAFEARANDSVAAWVATSPNRFVGLATLPLKDTRRAVVELDRALSLGLKGVVLPAYAAGDYLGAPRFEPIWTAVEARDIVAFIHPDGVRDTWYQERGLWNSVGQSVEEAKFLASIVLEGVLERHGDLKIVVSHGGGFLPHYIGRLDRNVTNMPDSADNISLMPSEYLRRLYYDTCVYDIEVLNGLVRRYGAEHIVLGSDYPIGERDPVGFVRRADDLSADDLALILGETGACLLGLA